jgi:hypothetical protein
MRGRLRKNKVSPVAVTSGKQPKASQSISFPESFNAKLGKIGRKLCVLLLAPMERKKRLRVLAQRRKWLIGLTLNLRWLRPALCLPKNVPRQSAKD